MNRITSRVSKNRTTSKVRNRTTGKYICMNRTTSRGCNNSITGKVRMYV